MYIKTFNIQNYMVHKDSQMNLSPLTVFVGPNGGGKSAFFDAMLNFSMLSRGSLPQAFGSYPYSFRATIHRGASRVARIAYEVSLSRSEQSDSYLDYEISYAQSQKEFRFTIFNEKLVKQPDGNVLFDRTRPDRSPLGVSSLLHPDGSIFAALRQKQIVEKKAPDDELLAYCTQRISQFNKFRLDPGVLAQPSRLPETIDEKTTTRPPRLGYNGEELAATLYHLAETRSPSLENIREKAKEIYPNFSDFEFNSVSNDRIAFSVAYSDSRKVVPSVRLSSGMLMYIGLIVLVSSPNRPPILMIEEPENGLTPQAVKAFYEAVRSLAFRDDVEQRSQVLMSSHSPFVICEAWNGEDRDFIHQVKVVDGGARIRKFTDIIAEQGIHLGKVKGERTHLSLNTADLVMSGYWS